MSNLENPNFPPDSNEHPNQPLSELKVDSQGIIREPGEQSGSELSPHYIDKYGELSKNVDDAEMAKSLEIIDRYLQKIIFAIADGKNSSDLHLLEERELDNNILSLVNLLYRVMKESFSVLAKPPVEINDADRDRAGKLLGYIAGIKERRRALVKALSLIDQFTDEEVWHETHIKKDQFLEIIDSNLNMEDSALWFTERKLFDLSRQKRHD